MRLLIFENLIKSLKLRFNFSKTTVNSPSTRNVFIGNRTLIPLRVAYVEKTKTVHHVVNQNTNSYFLHMLII